MHIDITNKSSFRWLRTGIVCILLSIVGGLSSCLDDDQLERDDSLRGNIADNG